MGIWVDSRICDSDLGCEHDVPIADARGVPLFIQITRSFLFFTNGFVNVKISSCAQRFKLLIIEIFGRIFNHP